MTPGLTKIIDNFVQESHNETLEYQRFKVLSDLTTYTIYDVESVRNVEKYQYFTSVHDEIVKHTSVSRV